MGYTLPKRFVPSFTFPPSFSLTMFRMCFALSPLPYIYIFHYTVFSSVSHSCFLLQLFHVPLRPFHLNPWPLNLISPSYPSVLFPPRLNAGHEQNSADHGEGRHAFLQRFLHHAHVLPVPLLPPDREVCAQPSHLHQQRELLLYVMAAAARAADLRGLPQRDRIQDR